MLHALVGAPVWAASLASGRIGGVLSLAAPAALGACAFAPPAQTAALRKTWRVRAESGIDPGATLNLAWGAVPTRQVLAEVPFFDQPALQCGPAVLASLLGASGVATTPEALAAQVFLPARGGSLQVEMLAAARRQGRLAVLLPPRLDAVLTEVAAGRPVAVLLNLGLTWWTEWHYAVAVGYDLTREEVMLHSGAQRQVRWALTTFELTWARAAHWAFVLTRPGELPRTATQADAESAALGFERVAAPAAALQAWAAVLTRWPDSLLAALGVGTMHFALSQWELAATQFERAAQRHDSAAAWNNLALARLQMGQVEAARQAAQRALARAERAEPGLLPAIRDTLAAMPP